VLLFGVGACRILLLALPFLMVVIIVVVVHSN
jgi:hypothetical protein